MSRDQQIADATERANESLEKDPLTRMPSDLTLNSQSKIRIQLIYQSDKLIVMVRHATNLVKTIDEIRLEKQNNRFSSICFSR